MIPMNCQCPVCCYPDLERPPVDFLICPCCGTEFEYDDTTLTHEQLRAEWTHNRAQWHSHAVQPPEGWNPWIQLIKGNHAEALPKYMIDLSIQASVTIAPRIEMSKQNFWSLQAA